MHCNVSEGAITIYLVILEHGVAAVLRWLCINSHGDCLIWFLESFQVEWHSPIWRLTLQCPLPQRRVVVCEKGSTGRAGGSLGAGNLLLCALHVVLDSWNSRCSQCCSVEATPTVKSQVQLTVKNPTSWYLLCWSFKICTKTPSSHLPIIKISAKYSFH